MPETQMQAAERLVTELREQNRWVSPFRTPNQARAYYVLGFMLAQRNVPIASGYPRATKGGTDA